MSNLEVIQIIASCVRAFHDGADRVELVLLRAARNDDTQRALSEREKALAEMLQTLLKEGGDAVSAHFQAAQKPMGQHARLLLEGDDKARLELLGILFSLQEEIREKLSPAIVNGEAKAAVEGLQALYRSATLKQSEVEQSITRLQQRAQKQSKENVRSSLAPSRRTSVNTMAREFRNDAISFSRGNSVQGLSSHRSYVTAEQQQLIPDIRADDIQSLAITDWDQDDRYTIAPERPQGTSFSAQGLMQRLQESSAESVRAAFAPEAIDRPAKPAVHLEEAGPYFDPADRKQSHEDREIPVLGLRLRESPSHPRPSRLRPSLPESPHQGRTDVMPWAQRMLSASSIKSGSSSPGISEPDSAISLRTDIYKAYCPGALAAQDNFILGFSHDYLPALPGAKRRELCWKCKECDFNFCDSEGQLLEGIYFEEGVRFRFSLLARSHVAYQHPENALKPAYHYGCLFCTAEGKRTSTYFTTEKLTSHIHAKHRTKLTPEVREKTRCIVGRSATREEQWDCNIADIGSQGGVLKKFMIKSLLGVGS